MKKTWQEKLEDKASLPKVLKLEKGFPCYNAVHKMGAGIFIMTAANAVEEASKKGKVLDIPYWRTLKSGGFLNAKYPGGQEAHKSLLEQEGHEISQKGKKFLVQDFQKHLV